MNLWGWQPKQTIATKIDWKRIYAFILQEHKIRPDELRTMTQVELLLYTINPHKETIDGVHASVTLEALAHLSLEEKIKLADLHYRLDTV